MQLHGEAGRLYHYQTPLGIHVEVHLQLESYALAVVMHGTLELNQITNTYVGIQSLPIYSMNFCSVPRSIASFD